MYIKKSVALFASCAFAATIGLSAAAQAATYNIDVDACSGSGCGLTNYGTISVTDVGGTGTDLHIDVSLVSTTQFHASSAGPHPTFVFNLNHTGAVGVSIDLISNNLPIENSAPHGDDHGWQFTSFGLGTYSPSGLGTFNFNIECTSAQSGNVCGQRLVLDVTGTGLSLFSNLVGTENVFFSLDIANAGASVLTGNVGATLDPPGGPNIATPLPGALPLFVSGLGAIAGLFGWRTKRKSAIAA